MKPETAPRFAGIGGHHSHRAGTVEWLTPPEIIAALGPFDLDPCAAIDQPWPTAAHHFTRVDNGLMKPWRGRAWMNPPYANGVISAWLERMAAHGHGTALIFARTETEAFFSGVWDQATALLFMRGRINFHFGERWQDPRTGRWYEIGERAPGNAGAPTVLCAYGVNDADVLCAYSESGERGKFVPLKFPRSILGAIISAPSNEDEKIIRTWRQALAEFFATRSGPVSLDELYRHFADHPKAATNPNYDAKIRQQLQKGPYYRSGRGLWESSQ